MKRIALSGTILGGFLAVLLQAAPANAQATRTWVSGVGDDVNPCSRTAPCKTFAGAISKTAANGEINCIDPGGFGTLTITKNITVDCGGTFGSTLNAGVNGFIITTGAANVILRNISIDGAGTGTNGVRILVGGKVLLENLQIFGNTGLGVDAQPASGNLKLSIKDVTVHHNTVGGIKLTPGGAATLNASLTRVNMHSNGFGMRTDDRARASVFQSVASENTFDGFIANAAAAATDINLVNSMSANQQNGVTTSGALATIRLFNSTILDNVNGINISSGTIAGTLPDTNLSNGNNFDGTVNANPGLQ